MHSHILTFIILPNVGYWKGQEIISKKRLSYTKDVLSTSKIRKNKVECSCEACENERIVVIHRLDGKIHSQNDLPAIEYASGRKVWYKKGKIHRKGNLPAWIENDSLAWYKNGHLHRENDLPAIEDYRRRTKSWYIKGKPHRGNNLPAEEDENGYRQWWVDGIFVKEEFTES